MSKKEGLFQHSLFEENYLVRTLGPLATSAEIALTELVANAWDAGATRVDITIPDNYDKKLIVQDNGVGLTESDFEKRWMTLGYNRIKHQGKNVIFPEGVQGKRMAYGRNGIGRHGLLCFNNEYLVITKSSGTKSTFNISTLERQNPFVIKDKFVEPAKGHGTRLEVIVKKNLPLSNKVLEVISARFLHDPNFVVYINKVALSLESMAGFLDSRPIEVDGIKLKVHFIDSLKAARTTIYQGIAFWQSGRLVGEPSWVLGNKFFLDGRTRYAKRYNIVVTSDDLSEFVLPDWTGFKKVDEMDNIYQAVGDYIEERFREIAFENLDETKAMLRDEFRSDFNSLSPLGKYEIDEAIDRIAATHPTARQESILLAVETLINLEKTRGGKELLLKLSTFTEDDVDGLNELLSKWSVRDALTVLEEIDYRLSVIEAIKKLSDDADVDELKVLHPLVTAARWLFGPEYESAEYASNRQLHKAVEVVFGKKLNKDVFLNEKKRPDLVVISNVVDGEKEDSTLSVTGTEGFDNDSQLVVINKVLVIELKRGKFKLSRKESSQAQGYVEDLIGCASLIGNPFIDCFVIGDTISEKMSPLISTHNSSKVETGRVRIATFSQLVDTASKRLFGLRKKLEERYDDIPGMNLFNRINNPGMQTEMEMFDNPANE